MLYDLDTLTEKQAEQLIGDKMLKRIKLLNQWLKRNNYKLLFHSTQSSNALGILKEGLKVGMHNETTIENLKMTSSITERELEALRNHAAKRACGGTLQNLCETVGTGAATVTAIETCTAKTLLEYNHLGKNATIVLCVPQKPKYQMQFDYFVPAGSDHFQRKRVDCKMANGIFEYYEQNLYPTESILFAYHRENKKILVNENFVDTYYLDKTPPTMKPGELLDMMQHPEKYRIQE